MQQPWEDVTTYETLVLSSPILLESDQGAIFTNLKTMQNHTQSDEEKSLLSGVQQLDMWRRISFWLGTLGAIYHFDSQGRDYIPGRTMGNLVWGVGWVSWLGLGALQRAAMGDLMEKHNASLQGQGAHRLPDDFGKPYWSFQWSIRQF